MLLLLSLVQLVYVVLLAPFFAGLLSTVEEKLESKSGPNILQRYFDLVKLFRKESVVPSIASPFFRIAPYATFTLYLFLTLVLPIITAFPLTFGPVVDFVGGGLIFGAAATVKKIAAVDSRSNYAHLGASRAASISSLSEPIMVLIFIMLGVLSGTNNPYIINNTLQTSSAWYSSLLHWFVVGAFFMVLLVETGQLPIESHTQSEFGMIDQGMPIEYSGPELAFFHWGGYVKQFLLMSVFLNVFSVPFWVPMKPALVPLLEYLAIHFIKMTGLTIIFALLNETVSKYRLYKIFDFIAMTFAFALLAGLAFFVTGGDL